MLKKLAKLSVGMAILALCVAPPPVAAQHEMTTPRSRNTLSLSSEDFDFYPLSIAERYYIWLGNESLAGSGIIQVGVRCRLWSADTRQVDVPGYVPIGCKIFDASGAELSEEDPRQTLTTRYIARALPILRDELFEGVNWKNYATIQFSLNLDTEALEPDVNLASGPLVERSMVPTELNRLGFRYPGEAIRARAEGTLTLVCQVQEDLSVICIAESFDQPEKLSYFAESAVFGGLGFTSGEELADGAPAAGARFRFSLDYELR